ncbi:MAG: hypothetical protein WDW36_006339 [Sanguina aurantia]
MSDDSLLRALCRRMCVGRSLVHARYTLMSRLLQCWPAAAAPAPVSLPFPVPNAGEQISGTLTLVCHFSTEVLRWVRMEEEARRPQRRRQQQQQQPGKSPGQGLVGMRQRELLRGAKPVLLQACSMRAIFPMMDAVTDTASEVSTATHSFIQLYNTVKKTCVANGRPPGGVSSSFFCTARAQSPVPSAHTTTPRQRDRDGAAHGMAAAVRKSLCMQIQAVAMAVVLQLCRYRVVSATSGHRDVCGRPVWKDVDFSTWKRNDVFRAFNDPSDARVKSLEEDLDSLKRDPVKAQAAIGPNLEKHALDNFHGRLLPGCCHLGCEDLSGVSEAALPTLLCGGCRRARYCSVGCQREAWLEGGHSMVCGK